MTVTIAAESAISSTEMRATMAMVPTAVAVVSAESSSGRVAMVVGSFVSVSLEPPLVGFLVTDASTTWPQLQQAGTLGISALSAKQSELCRMISKKEEGRFADEHWEAGHHGAPLIRDAVATIECRIKSVSRAGDHDLVLCRVLRLAQGIHSDPLVFQNRAFSGLVSR